MSAAARDVTPALFTWTEHPCAHVGALDLSLFVNGRYFGIVCTSTARVGEWDGFMVAVIGDSEPSHFKTREECVAFMEMAAAGGERGRA